LKRAVAVPDEDFDVSGRVERSRDVWFAISVEIPDGNVIRRASK
jgi:hypothetical protein